nr:hypothetical protein CFP56_27663 [Quercus suber]
MTLSVQADLEAGDTQIDEESDLEAYESKSVQVKFQIQKVCMFGEQFLIVGDDPKLGLWDPSSAIPLDWSEGHVWTAELKGNAGKILWQPGPDRIFKTWETKNTIIVCEDWENPEYQKVIEGEQLANQNEQQTVNSDMLIVAQNLTFPKDELVSYVNEGSANAESNTSTAENSIAEPHKAQIIADNIAPSQEKTKAMVADNISYSKEDPKVNAKDILESNGRASTLIEDNLNNYGSGEVWGDLPRLHRRWGTPTLVKRRPKLKSRYKERVEKAIEYAQTIESWDDLVDPRALAFYCLGPEPSSFVLRNLEIEGKKKMTTKFNKGMYAKMRSKKDEPLSNLGKKAVRVTEKGGPVPLASSVSPIASRALVTRTASPTTSVEEIGGIPVSKRLRLTEKENEKGDPRPSTIWSDERLAVDWAHEVVIAADLKILSGVPYNDMAARHVQKLVQGGASIDA